MTSNKAQNLQRAKDKIKEAVSEGAKIVALPVGFALIIERFYFAVKVVLVTWQIYNNFVRSNAMLSAKFKNLTLQQDAPSPPLPQQHTQALLDTPT